MSLTQIFQSIVTALIIAGIFAVFRLFRDVDQLKTTQKYEVEAIKANVKPVIAWYEKTSMDALKIATNPTSEQLTNLADKYIASVTGRGTISTQEKQELIDGLRRVMNDPNEHAGKRSSASMSLRFIETREGLTAKGANH